MRCWWLRRCRGAGRCARSAPDRRRRLGQAAHERAGRPGARRLVAALGARLADADRGPAASSLRAAALPGAAPRRRLRLPQAPAHDLHPPRRAPGAIRAAARARAPVRPARDEQQRPRALPPHRARAEAQVGGRARCRSRSSSPRPTRSAPATAGSSRSAATRATTTARRGASTRSVCALIVAAARDRAPACPRAPGAAGDPRRPGAAAAAAAPGGVPGNRAKPKPKPTPTPTPSPRPAPTVPPLPTIIPFR